MMQNFVRPASRTLESRVRRLDRNWHDVFLRDLVGSNQDSGGGGDPSRCNNTTAALRKSYLRAVACS
jgi:hypothetical protein